MKTALKIVLPLVVLLIAAAGAWGLVTSRPALETVRPEAPPPSVRTQTVRPEDVRMKVTSQGTVRARTTSQLVPEVTGRVVGLSPSFREGGFFSEGDVLLRIEPHDYERNVAEARSRVAQSELRLAQERAAADVARREWSEIGDGDGSPLALRELQVAEAEAARAAAVAALAQAERDLDRTRVRAPFDGRVMTKLADVGQVVTRGAPVATLYSVDVAEIRLPISGDELEFLDLPLGYRHAARGASGPPVEITAELAGSTWSWRGRVMRTDGQIDPTTRLLNAVAEVGDPYGRHEAADRPPLAVGMFVRAEIEGRVFADVVVLPRVALREDGRVLVVGDDDRLAHREIELLRTEGDTLYVESGLEEGERVLVSPLETVVEGMKVEPVGEASAEAGIGEEAAS